MKPRSTPHRAGFTLIELSIVILIIGLLTSFLLVVSWEGLRRAEERATQALISKLDVALNDRYEALTSLRPRPNDAHRYLAMSETGDPERPFIESEQRAELIALVDMLRAELPDVFFVQDDPLYPLNFAGLPYHPSPVSNGAVSQGYFRYSLPLGNGVWNGTDMSAPSRFFWNTPGGNVIEYPLAGGNLANPAGTGIFGASYQAIAAITKQLGYPERGRNGVDDNGNGLIDEISETEWGVSSAQFQAIRDEVLINLAQHEHATARSEMLYAILIEGAGPFGSVFERDDFTDNEVQDTDGDNLLEFVDAWGRPLQFYRWPVYHVTELGAQGSFQKGSSEYFGRVEAREENPLDPNRLLISPGWWLDVGTFVSSGDVPDNSAQMSTRANLFQKHFFSLVDPRADSLARNSPPGRLWDRTNFYKRRAYFSKPLILSSGPDGFLGVGSFGVVYSEQGHVNQPPQVVPTDGTHDAVAARMTVIENQASRSDPFARMNPNNKGQAGPLTIDEAAQPGRLGLYQVPSTGSVNDFTFLILEQWGLDDITNHGINTPSTGGF